MEKETPIKTVEELFDDIGNKFETLSGIIQYENKNKLDKTYYNDLCVEINEFVKEVKSDKFIQEVKSQVRDEERRFVLNVLDGIDIADEQMGNKTGGTKAIRIALQSRI